MSTEITILKPGTKVHYVPKDDFMSFENGIVKNAAAIPDCVWVVYSCNNDWNKYYAYSSALTEIKYLRLGWRS